MIILICVLVIAAFVDILCYRIPNMWIVIGMLAGLVQTVAEGDLLLLGQTVFQLIIVFVAFYPFYLMKGLGAGDVKLFLVLGCYVRGVAYLYCLFGAMMLAAVWAIMKMFCQKESRERLFYLGQYCKKAIMTGVLDEYEVDKGNQKSVIRLSVPVLCSALLWYGGQYL